MTARTVSADWPLDPLGGRRAAVEGGAELVRQAALRAHVRARPATSDGVASDRAVPHEAASDAAVAERIAHWQRDLDALLAERARMLGADVIDVDLPDRLSVTQLVALRNDPAELARSLHRPLPARPAPLARRGTRFHEWLEQRWQSSSLLDIDELPGAADEGATDADLQVLQEAFRRSPWWVRTPAHVEVPFEMTIAGTVVRGRMDAVFEESGGGWTVVDWKTGSRPSGARARAADVQLAVYRLAWAALNGIPDDQLHRVGAAFHYVASNETVRPHDLLDAAGLRALITGLPG
jgi:DNA helicase-2/ATP-dependent DNA helicase PcrA